jgi:2-(1,2-epoxy-1,2-dihydrophenyl)acetyl-CoA isomerase
MANNIKLTESDDIAIVTMDNGDQINTIDIELCQELRRELNHIAHHGEHRAVILQANGKGFSAGGDLAQIASAIERSDDAYLDELITKFHSVILTIRQLAVPVIASVHGAAAGAGFSLALACDVAIAESGARFIAGYPKLGTSTDGGLSFQLTRRLGAARAIDVLLYKDSLTAAEALALGLIQDVCAPETLESAALASAKRMTRHPRAGIAETKRLVSRLADADLAAHLEQEKQAFIRCAATDDFRKRIGDFIRQSGSQKT